MFTGFPVQLFFLWWSRDQCSPGCGFRGFTLFQPFFYLHLGRRGCFPQAIDFYVGGTAESQKLRKMLQLEEQLFLQVKNPPTFLVERQLRVSSWHSASFAEALSKLAEVVVYLILQVWVVPCEKIKRANLVGFEVFFFRGVDILPLFVGSMESRMDWRSWFLERFHGMRSKWTVVQTCDRTRPTTCCWWVHRSTDV